MKHALPLSVAAAMRVAALPLSGELVDTLGCRPMLFVGTVCAACSFLVTASATADWHIQANLVAASFTSGLSEMARTVLPLELGEAERLSHETNAGAVMMALSLALGWLGPALRAVTGSSRAPFLVAAALTLVKLMLTYALAPETLRGGKDARDWGALRRPFALIGNSLRHSVDLFARAVFARRGLTILVAAWMVFMMATHVLTQALFPYMIENLGYSAQSMGLYSNMSAVGFLASNMAVQQVLLPRTGLYIAAAYGQFISILCYGAQWTLATVLGPHTATRFCAMTAISMLLLSPSAELLHTLVFNQSIRYLPAHERGALSGAFGVLGGTLAAAAPLVYVAVSPILMGPDGQIGDHQLFLFGAAASLFVLLIIMAGGVQEPELLRSNSQAPPTTTGGSKGKSRAATDAEQDDDRPKSSPACKRATPKRATPARKRTTAAPSKRPAAADRDITPAPRPRLRRVVVSPSPSPPTSPRRRRPRRG